MFMFNSSTFTIHLGLKRLGTRDVAATAADPTFEAMDKVARRAFQLRGSGLLQPMAGETPVLELAVRVEMGTVETGERPLREAVSRLCRRTLYHISYKTKIRVLNCMKTSHHPCAA